MRRRRLGTVIILSVVAVIGALLLPFGCDQSSILSEININEATLETGGSHSIEITGDASGTPKHVSVSVCNTGVTPIEVARIAFTDPENFSVYARDIPGTIEPGESSLIDISFHPAGPGVYHSELDIHVGSGEPTFKLLVTAGR